MTGENRIVAFGANEGSPAGANGGFGQSEPIHDMMPDTGYAGDATLDTAWDADSAADDEAPVRGPSPRLPALLAGAATLGWTVFFAIAQAPRLRSGAAADAIAGLISAWSGPVLLIGIVWLLVMRHSAREGRRFGDVARQLSLQSHELEVRLGSVNRELSLAREFVAAQARDLEALGRIAADRLSQNAETLRTLIADNGARVDTIGNVSKAALDNMEKLRGQLPVIASSAKDVTNNIGNAGRAAHAQLEDMINGFNRLNDFGTASERQVATLRQAVEESLGEFAVRCDQLEVLTNQRFAALNEQSDAFRTALDLSEVDALAAMRSRIAALTTEIEATRGQLDRHEAESLTSLRARLGALRDESDVVSRALTAEQARTLAQWQADLAELETAHDRAARAMGAAQTAALASLSERLAAIEADTGRIDGDIASRAGRIAADAEARRQRMAELETEAANSFAQTLAGIEARMADHQASHRQHADQAAFQAEALNGRLREAEASVRQIVANVRGLEDEMTTHLGTLGDRLNAARATLASTDGDVMRLTDSSLRLLEMIQAGSKHAHEKLPEALAFSEDRLARTEARIQAMLATLHQSGENSVTLGEAIEACNARLSALATDLAVAHEQVDGRGADQVAAMDALRCTIEDIEAAAARVSAQTRDDLATALRELAQAQADAAATFEDEGAARITTFAGTLGDESVKAVDKAMRARVAEISGQLEQAVAHASGVSREATGQLREELTQVDKLLENLEQRVADARRQAEDQVDNDFARRAALITESLNSSAIDISTALSTDIADTAWAAYLRGDRGIFTRRAVSLLEAGEARSIQQVYERDDAFREQVNRYIHDFEAILRQVLSTRDGNALGVTLLSSDMGKLYVALAQGIERLRG
ncbi:ATPase [Novosphingobium colocasiae]|nr:ATPase [Novosphingobium colocasiae]